MLVLPSMREYVQRRPDRPPFEDSVLIASQEGEGKEFWEKVYSYLRDLSPQQPVKREKHLLSLIHPEHGFFGFRTHPITKEKKHFHLGIEIPTKMREEIHPLFDGVLEYSGFGALSGYYVLLSHPDIQTEDGYILHTLYCHMKRPLVKFSAHQKMLREISLGTYPIVPIAKEKTIGLTGSTGKTAGTEPVLYFQADFRKFEHRPIVIDPLKLFEEKTYRNKKTNT